MKINQPVTQNEVMLSEFDTIVTKTDLKGIVTYANHDFIRISGFSEAELLGKNHNLVRHPDMPEAAFADLWTTLKKGRPWNGLVKNRCKNGDYYWVNAYVAPIEENGKVTGYTSMRTKPNRDQIDAASRLYRELASGHAGFRLEEGRVVSTSLISALNPIRWLDKLRAKSQLIVLMATMLIGMVALGVVGYAAMTSATADQLTDATILRYEELFLALLAVVGSLVMVLGICVYRNLSRAGDTLYLGEVVRHVAVGNLAIRIDTASESADSLLQVVKQLQSRLQMLVRLVSEKANLVSNESDDMVQAAGKVDAAVVVQSESAASVAATTEELTVSISQVSDNAQEALQISKDSSKACEQGVAVIQSAVTSMEQIANTVRSASQTVLTLGSQSEHISSVVHVIQDIADQTNLLALNAAIEAARAGEQGRGFAVVADEVRKLAERTSSATREIEAMITSIQSGLQSAVASMESGVGQVDSGVALASEAGQAIAQIRESSIQVAQVVAEISHALDEQRSASHLIANQVENIAMASEQNSAIARETSQAATHLKETAIQMQNSVSCFVV